MEHLNVSGADGIRGESSDNWAQRVGGLVEIPGLLRELGADPAEILRGVGLDVAALGHVENRIPYTAAARLLGHCARETQCAHFGLLAGQRWQLSHFGALGELMRNSRTVGEALRTLVVYQHLNSDAGAAFVLVQGATISLGYTIYRAEIPHRDHVYDLTLAFIYNMLRELCGSRWTASKVFFSRVEPVDPGAYRPYFRAPLSFDHVHSAVQFRAHWGRRSIPRADPEQRRALAEAMEAKSSGELVARLHRSLRLLLLMGKSSGEDLAQTLSLHRRTLNRRLKAQGTTFQTVLDQVRFETARELLEGTRTSMENIASALCYSEVSAFIHAFQRWSGTTPTQWRRTARRR